MKGLCVLVVDDSSLMRGLLAEAIRASDVPIDDVQGARDGVEALEVLGERHIDVVITDLQMPRVDGFELVARIALRRDLAHLRIITMSADTSPREALRATAMKVHARLTKPVRFDTVKAVLAEIWALGDQPPSR